MSSIDCHRDAADFGTAFFDDMRANPELPKRWNGLRQDSGDPFEFIHVAIGMYQSLGIDPSESELGFLRSSSTC